MIFKYYAWASYAKAGIYHGRLRNMYQVHKTFKILL